MNQLGVGYVLGLALEDGQHRHALVVGDIAGVREGERGRESHVEEEGGVLVVLFGFCWGLLGL